MTLFCPYPVRCSALTSRVAQGVVGSVTPVPVLATTMRGSSAGAARREMTLLQLDPFWSDEVRVGSDHADDHAQETELALLDPDRGWWL